ncbi:NUDIX hydrolase [Paracoccus contaminans]|uniref:Nudix hydrolase domain-containing protein n=1 Tax=Paracoccus contaminans TaxID=1945662 RepID=A0A1W6D0E5_9RHOB|nr:NUDIX hydrolase [Paracoccus contaminans]ARJ70576.1 hypothetical protein B0A89_14030 [Paracoccus contaminans]
MSGAPPNSAPPIRDAATVVVIDRDGPEGAAVLMGRRGANAAFMPSKYVFPGGAVDAEDEGTPCPAALSDHCRLRLEAEPRSAVSPDALVRAALRELAEETGLALSPDAGNPLVFVFRAITPPGRTRRFDARFFLIEARRASGAAQDFTAACDELSHLHWVPLARARELDMPFITEIVLAEVAALIAAASGGPLVTPARVPFFDNSGDESRLVHLP